MLTLLCALAYATDEPPESERQVDLGAPRFVLVLEDLDRTLKGKTVEAVVGERSHVLRDDGRSPDPVPDDGLYAENVDSQPTERVLIRITADGELVGEKELLIGADLVLASVRVDLKPDGLSWRVQQDRPVNSGEKPLADEAWTAESDRVSSLDGATGPDSHVVAAGVGLALSALLSGLLLARRRTDEPARSLGSESAASIQGDTVTVVREAGRTTNVLLVPRPDARPHLTRALADVPSAVWREQDRPNPHAIARAMDHLAERGPAALVVQGPDALEKPGSKEGANAALDELTELAEWPLYITS